MATTTVIRKSTAQTKGEPPWDVALLYPPQGEWTEAEYLALDARGGRLVELVDGNLEVLPMPKLPHQLLAAYFFKALSNFVDAQKSAACVACAPLPVRLWKGRLREPDVVYLGPKRAKKLRQIPDGADLVMEVVSEGTESRRRDLIEKRSDYARAKVSEYWIVDPKQHQITVLVLSKAKYKVYGEFTSGEQAASVLLSGFEIDVAALFAVAEPYGDE